uniref:Lrp/AsnC family transcriptional regulator n=1 Tax=Ningiella ruwaisensis TaxID=2364274 RepID=UPI0010A0359D|nr:Lrp/AsnC family transcriptional regulator [Ningiella ruwaisensis]
MQLTKNDIEMLTRLERSARVSFSELAEEVGLSKTPCWNRVKMFEREGIINGYHTELNAQALGIEIRAFVHVVLNFNESEAFEKAVSSHPNILRCDAVTGDFDYLLEIAATNMQRLDDLLRKELSKLPGIARFSTSISTRSVKTSTQLMPLVKY